MLVSLLQNPRLTRFVTRVVDHLLGLDYLLVELPGRSFGFMETTILLVEDSAEDCEAVRRALHEAGVKSRLCVVEDGDHAISYLCGEGRYANRSRFPYPSIMFLDLKMPRVDGFEVLEWIKDNPDVRRAMLVVVLSGHNQLKLVNRAYSLGAHSFLVKPISNEELENLISAFPEFWKQRECGYEGDRFNTSGTVAATSASDFSFQEDAR